jgi:hypothetical protein
MKISLAIDGSTDSDAAVDEVAGLPWPPDIAVKLLTVIEMPIFPIIDPPWLVYLDKVEQHFGNGPKPPFRPQYWNSD